MSKMSEIAMELDDQAIELGFESYEEAIAKGYEVDYENCKLINPYVLDREQDKAHEAWVKERDNLLKEMKERVGAYRQHGYNYDMQLMEKAIEFIEKGEC